ncbi:MAG: hypothetical protein SCARUB_01360 [Candidatus Scalindua rubra]|uniref:Uncharacterized protein n=1 Tax=Candidatus Scalindua rubra TaxID=1872076 RepID=A0A1E3XD34_9BACT|nr:MAG: hypothetical protein SCARUB_01360 [Candidatus Scalindua rubra]
MKIRIKSPLKKCPNCFGDMVRVKLEVITLVWLCSGCGKFFEIDDSSGEFNQLESKEIFGDT